MTTRTENRSSEMLAHSGNAIPAERSERKASVVRLELFGTQQMTEVMKLWEKLERQLKNVPLACSYDWTRLWLKNYAELIRPWFVVGRVDNKIVGICLLTESTQPVLGTWKAKSLHLGTAGEPHGHSVCVEYNDLLVEPTYRREFCHHLQHLIGDEPGWDQFHLDGIPVNDSAWPVGPDLDLQQGTGLLTPNWIIRQRESRYFDLAEMRNQQSDILSQLGKSTRSNIKRRLKQLGETKLTWAESVDQAHDVMNQLIDLHQQRWNAVGQPGAFASERFHQFQRDLIEHLHPQNRVVLAKVETATQIVGCLYLLVDRNRLLDYVSGLADFDVVPSPGLLSHYLCMEGAAERNYDAYDFLVGDKRHKENLGKSSQLLQWIIHERPRWKYTVRDGGRWLKRKLKGQTEA